MRLFSKFAVAASLAFTPAGFAQAQVAFKDLSVSSSPADFTGLNKLADIYAADPNGGKKIDTARRADFMKRARAIVAPIVQDVFDRARKCATEKLCDEEEKDYEFFIQTGAVVTKDGKESKTDVVFHAILHPISTSEPSPRFDIELLKVEMKLQPHQAPAPNV